MGIIKIGKSYWISQEMIIKALEVDEVYLKKARYRFKKSVPPSLQNATVLPHTGKSWRWTRQNGRFYYCYDAIPDRSPAFYRTALGDVADAYTKLQAERQNNEAESLNRRFMQFVTDTYNIYMSAYGYPHTQNKSQQEKLSMAAATLEFTVRYRNEHPDMSDSAVCKVVAGLIDRHNLSYIPSHYKKLKQKLKRYDAGESITEIIRLPRAGNNNSLLYDDPEVISWAIQLRQMSQNYTNEFIIRKVTDMCRRTEKPVPSRRWFGINIFEKQEIKYLTAVNRFGSNTRGSKIYEGYVPIQNALFAGDAWQVDATRVNLIAHKTAEGKQAFLFMIVVRDVHSGDILGYHFDYKEDRWSVLNAVKMAVQEAGYLPYQLVFDRFPGHNTPEAKEFLAHLEKLKVNVTFTHKATGKAQLERWFGTLQTVFMQESEYYYGQGVQSTREYAHRSPEYLKQIRRDAHKMGFDFIKATQEATKIIEAFRNTPYSYYSKKHRDINESPKLMHAQSEKPNVVWAKEQTISLLFGHKKEVSISHEGYIVTDIYKTEHVFRVDDFNIIKDHKRIWISYDLEDLSKVDLFVKHDNLYAYIGTAPAFKRVQVYGPQAEFNRLAKAKQRNKQIAEQRKAALAEKTALADETDLLMGRFTDKNTKEQTETALLLQAAGDEMPTQAPEIPEEDIDFVSMTINKY